MNLEAGETSFNSPMIGRFNIHKSNLSSIDRLFSLPAFDFSHYEEHFVAAMREAASWHYKNSWAFKGHCDLANFDVRQISSIEDVLNIPWIFVQNFKEHELLSVKPEEIELVLTSSGTKGIKTQLFLDSESLNRLEVAAFNVYRDMGILGLPVAPKESFCNYLLFTYDIKAAPNLGTAWTDVLIADMVPSHERIFLIRKTEAPSESSDGFRFDMELAIESYLRFAKSDQPIRILGFPAFIYEFLKELERRDAPKLKNTKESWILTGGGWKNYQGEAIPKREFASYVESLIGIPSSQVRDLFGMAEHGVGYVDCEEGRLHVPVYSYALTRDPFTLNVNPDGVSGLLHLYSPLQHGYPSISLLTVDEAIVHATPCGCGRAGKTLEIVGRVGLKNYASCAIRALEYLK